MMSRVQELTSRYLNHQATPDEIAELEQYLICSSEAADYFARLTRLESALENIFRQERAQRDLVKNWHASHRHSTRWGPRVALAALAASLLFVLVELASRWMSQEPVRDHYVEAGQVEVAGKQVRTILSGERLHVRAGEPALLRLADGSRVHLAPETTAVLHGEFHHHRQLIELEQGAGAFQVAKGDGDFRVKTPLGSVAVPSDSAASQDTSFVVVLPVTGKAFNRAMTRDNSALAVASLAGPVQVECGSSYYTLSDGESRVFTSDDQSCSRQVTGILKEVDVDRGMVTFAVPEIYDAAQLGLDEKRFSGEKFSVLKPHTCTLDQNVKAMIGGIETTLTNLRRVAKDTTALLGHKSKPGVQATLKLSGDGTTALEINVDRELSQQVIGELLAVDEKKETITIAIPQPIDAKNFKLAGKEKSNDVKLIFNMMRPYTYNLSQDVKIMFGCTAATLADIQRVCKEAGKPMGGNGCKPPGAEAILKLAEDGITVKEIHVLEVTGELLAINLKDETITLALPDTEIFNSAKMVIAGVKKGLAQGRVNFSVIRPFTYFLLKQTKVTMDNKAATLSDVAKVSKEVGEPIDSSGRKHSGAKVTLRLSSGTDRSVTEITVHPKPKPKPLLDKPGRLRLN